MTHDKESILGFSVETHGVQGCVEEIVASIMAGEQRRWLACLNPHSCSLAHQDELFSAALRSADWLIPDGVGIVLASKLLGGRIRERVTGSDIFWEVMQQLNEDGGYSVFFLGSTDETVAEIRARMARDFPNLWVVGTYSPPFKPVFSDEEVDAMVAAVNMAAPDVLWVGMTAPKQEKWIYPNLHKLDVRFIGAIGAVFDFYAGRVRRPNLFFQRLGLEWLLRFLGEPKRLWRRNLVSNPTFMLRFFKARLNGSRNEDDARSS